MTETKGCSGAAVDGSKKSGHRIAPAARILVVVGLGYAVGTVRRISSGRFGSESTAGFDEDVGHVVDYFNHEIGLRAVGSGVALMTQGLERCGDFGVRDSRPAVHR